MAFKTQAAMSNKHASILADTYVKSSADGRAVTNFTTNFAASLTDDSAAEYATKFATNVATNSATELVH